MQNPKQQSHKNKKIIQKKYVVDMNTPIGAGSYCSVYLAVLKDNPSKQMACKIISKEAINNQVMNSKNMDKAKLLTYIINRIKEEIVISKKIKHPNIVKFIDFEETQKNIYLFMELCQSNLSSYLKEFGAIPERQALPIIKDIVEGACFLYENSITHRDIKPQNVLLLKGHAKLADFGFAKQLNTKDMVETQSGLGTEYYMAPQLMFQERPHYSIKCDVWSIGVVIFQILYASLPWKQKVTTHQEKLTLMKPIEFPSVASKFDVSPSMKNLISRMLIYGEEDRISIKDVRMELIDIIQNLMDFQ